MHTSHSTVPDWERESITEVYEPWKRLLRCIREHARLVDETNPVIKRLRMRWVVYRYRFWSAVCGVEIPFSVSIEGGFSMPHPNGIVIHPDAKIGPNCTIFQQVTLGLGTRPGVPELGANVVVGAGAKILGGIIVGDNARVGANAVVLSDVPDGATVVGIPGRIVSDE